jgi:phthalate 4,5-dioxygenase oxygenase subunit
MNSSAASQPAPMGEMFRRYWWPVLLSTDLPEGGKGCVPRRITVMGESYVAFRGTDGKAAILDEHCPHRGALLALGIVEDCAILCLYHGWKMGADGAVQDAPNVADEKGLKGLLSRFKTGAYPVREAGDLIWAYFGPANKVPAFAEYHWLGVPRRNSVWSAVVLDANYLQSIENLVDPSHLGLLHQDAMRKMTQVVDRTTAATVMKHVVPRLEVQLTDFGFRLAALRPHENSWRVRAGAYAAPAFIFIPASPRSTAGGCLRIFPSTTKEHRS